MLVLSRKNCESVVVGDPAHSIKQSFKVTVLEIQGDKVKLGFEAAGDVHVNRLEVWKNIRSSVRVEQQQKDPSQWVA